MYKIEQLFEVVGTKSLDSNALDFVQDGINFIGRTSYNNGIQGKIKKRNFEPNEPFTITATVVGNYKYVKFQTKPYYCSQNINKLTPKATMKKWNAKIAYYLIVSLQKFVSMYDGQQGGYRLSDIKNHLIQIPIKNGEIDFQFMEHFIDELEKYKIKEFKSHLHATEFVDYNLNEKEKYILSNFENIRMKEISIIDLFYVKNTGNILSNNIIKNSGDIPYLCASAENNGVSSYINYDISSIDKGNCVFIGGKTFVVSYQEKDFFSNDSHNLALYLKEDSKKNKLTQLFLAACINKSLRHKYSWGNSISNEKIQTDKISIPFLNGEPDFEIMQTLILAIFKNIIKDLFMYVDNSLMDINL